MDIYKLSDEIPVSRKTGDADDVLKITNMKQGVKNANRVNIFVNGKYSFSLDVSQVVDLKIKVGKEITEAELSEYKRQSEYGKLYQKTLEWAMLRPRSVKETREYLYRKLRMSSSGRSSHPSSRGSSLSPRSDCGLPSEDTSKFSSESASRSSEKDSKLLFEIVSRLVEKGYVDDSAFAKWYVDNRFVKKGVSMKRLKMELIKKGISREIVDEALGARDDEEEIMKIIAKKRAKYDDEKLIQYLCRQGFPFELANEKVRSYGKD